MLHSPWSEGSFLCQVRPRFPIVFKAWLEHGSCHLIDTNSRIDVESTDSAKNAKSNHPTSQLWVCSGKDYYFDQQFQSIPSVSRELNESSLIDFLRMYARTRLLVLSKQSFAIDLKFFRRSTWFSPALYQLFAIYRILSWWECHYRFFDISHFLNWFHVLYI